MTVILSNIGMHCDHTDKKLRDQLTQQLLQSPHPSQTPDDFEAFEDKQPRLEIHSVTLP